MFDAKNDTNTDVCQNLSVSVTDDNVELYQANLTAQCQVVFSNPHEIRNKL